MRKNEIIAHEHDDTSEMDLGLVLRASRALKSNRTQYIASAFLSERVLAQDWLKPEEEEAWADL